MVETMLWSHENLVSIDSTSYWLDILGQSISLPPA